jgi:heptosyltransferase I
MKQLRTGSAYRLADRFAGSAILYVKGIFRKKRSLPEEVHRAAFLKTAALGDTVLISAIVRDFKAAHPRAELVFVCGDDNAAIAEMTEGVNTVVRINHKRPLEAVRTVKALGNFNLVIDFGSWPRFDAYIASCFSSKCTVGFETENQKRHYCYDITVKHSGELHELSNYRNLAEAAGIRPVYMPELNIDKDLRIKGRVIFHMFSGGRKYLAKEWSRENWLVLAEELISKDYEIILTGSGNDAERALEFAEESGAEFAGELTLDETAFLLTGSELVISVNTGIMHMAAALGCRVVDICGPVKPERWGGKGTNVISLACAEPYISLGFEEGDENCMEEITPEDVLEASGRFIKL